MSDRRSHLVRALARSAVGLSLALSVLACGGTAASVSPLASPSPSVAPITPPPTPIPTPTPTPVASPSSATGQGGGPQAEALVAALASEPLITHIEQIAEAAQVGGPASNSVKATLAGDIDGEDLSFHLTTTVGGVTTEQDIAVIGDSAYVREGTEAWGSAPKAVVQPSLDGLTTALRLTDDPADLRYVGVEVIEGRQLHHLTASRAIPYVPAAGGTGQYDVFDIWTEADGTPVLARTAFSAKDPAGNEFRGTTEFRYSNFGGPIEIATPSVGP